MRRGKSNKKRKNSEIAKEKKISPSPFDKELQSSTSAEWNYVGKRIYQYYTYASFKVLHERKIKIGQETERKKSIRSVRSEWNFFFLASTFLSPRRKKLR